MLTRVGDLEFNAPDLAVAYTKGNYDGHVGLAFHSARDGAQLIHLKWHKKLEVTAYPPGGCWIACIVELNPSLLNQAVSIVRAVAKRKPNIPFGIGLLTAMNSFDENGKYSPHKDSDGLTCATFVAALFDAMAIPLVKLETWEPSAANRAWGAKVCADLTDTRVEARHVEKVKENVNGLRLRPEEVVAAGGLPAAQRPTEFRGLQEAADQVIASRAVLCPDPPALPPALAADPPA